MKRAKVENGIVVKYPYTIWDLRKDNPNVSFRDNPLESVWLDYNVYIVQDTERPTGDVVTEETPMFLGNACYQNWSERDFTEAEKSERRQAMVVEMRQARLALLQAGLLSSVEAAIAGLEEPVKSYVEIEWEYSITFERAHEWVQSFSSALGLSEEQLDKLFELAATL